MAPRPLFSVRRPKPVGRAASMNSDGVLNEWKKHSIYPIPSYMKDQNPKAYTPRLVSIGPYHHGASRLEDMEKAKARSLKHLLTRSNQPIGEYLEALNGVSDSLIASYQQLDERWKTTPSDFLELMLKDGSFLWEYFRGRSDGWDYHPEDPVFSQKGELNYSSTIIPDILMMENQIPLIVIERMMAVQAGQVKKQYDKEAQELVYKFLSCTQPFPSFPLGLHVLDVTKKVIMQDFQQKSKDNHLPDGIAKSASELLNAGVRFRANGATGKKGISFENGTLNLPLLIFNSSIEPLFLNGVAFEKLHPTAGHEMNSYVAFMQGFISSANDVRILTSLHLIERSSGKDEDVADTIKTISEHASFDPYSELAEVRELLEMCYAKNMKNMKRRLRDWGQKLLHDYFRNPCTILSLFAAMVILLLTFLQTLYSMKAFYN